MDRRHTRTSPWFWVPPAGWSLSRVLPWIFLLVVVSATAYGIQRAATSMVPSVTADQLDESYLSLRGHEIRQQRGASPQAGSTSSTGVVVITGQNARTGDRIQVECMTASDRIASKTLLVELKDLDEVAAQACNVANAPAVRR
jgi:hypothetical protein